MQAKPEYILCAAIWHQDGVERVHLPRNITSGLVVAGWRHHNCFTVLSATYPEHDATVPRVQGFLTSKGNFVDRKVAAEIAFAAGQTTRLLTKLTSEDVW